MRLAILSFVGAFVLGLGACGDKDDSHGDGYVYMDDDIPSGRCGEVETGGEPEDCPESSGSGSTTSPVEGSVGSACGRSTECDGELVCSAPFSQGDRGAFACVESCIEFMDEYRWCADASACCDPEAVCTARGYCLEGE
jgi:hypothetical protein